VPDAKPSHNDNILPVSNETFQNPFCIGVWLSFFLQLTRSNAIRKVPCSFVDQTGNVERVLLFGEVAENFLRATVSINCALYNKTFINDPQASEIMTMEKSEIELLVNSLMWQKYAVYLKVSSMSIITSY